MGGILSFLFPDTDLGEMEIYDYEDTKGSDESNRVGFANETTGFTNDIILIHPSIPRLTWIKVVKEDDPVPESYLRVIPISVFCYASDPNLDEVVKEDLRSIGDTYLDENRLFILVPDFRPCILERMGLWFLSPWHYTRVQVIHSLIRVYECMLNAALATTYRRVRLPPLALETSGEFQDEMDLLTAEAVATACSRERFRLMVEQEMQFELVLTPEEVERYERVISSLTR